MIEKAPQGAFFLRYLLAYTVLRYLLAYTVKKLRER